MTLIEVKYVHLKLLKQWSLPSNTTLPIIGDKVLIDHIHYIVSRRVWDVSNMLEPSLSIHVLTI